MFCFVNVVKEPRQVFLTILAFVVVAAAREGARRDIGFSNMDSMS